MEIIKEWAKKYEVIGSSKKSTASTQIQTSNAPHITATISTYHRMNPKLGQIVALIGK